PVKKKFHGRCCERRLKPCATVVNTGCRMRLLMSQRAERIHPRRAPRGYERRDDHDTQHERERARERDGVGRTHAVQHAAEQPSRAERDDDAYGRADRTEAEATLEKTPNDRKP